MGRVTALRVVAMPFVALGVADWVCAWALRRHRWRKPLGRFLVRLGPIQLLWGDVRLTRVATHDDATVAVTGVGVTTDVAKPRRVGRFTVLAHLDGSFLGRAAIDQLSSWTDAQTPLDAAKAGHDLVLHDGTTGLHLHLVGVGEQAR